MENTKIKNNLKKVVEKYEDVIFGGKKIDIKDFYNVKRLCLKHELMDLIQIMDILESMIEKRHNDLLNKHL